MGSVEKTDVAIVGAGLAGSLVASMLGKAGIRHVLIDPRAEYPDEFRCEKFNSEQISLLKETGIADPVFEAITPVNDVWMSRFGRLVRKMDYPHFGFSYQTAVNALRKNAVGRAYFRQASVLSIQNSAERQKLVMDDGNVIDARLVVLASGVNENLQQDLGFRHEMISQRHCLAIGFDVAPAGDEGFPFDTMTYWPEKASGKMSYLTFFKAGEGWRANLFGYWQPRDLEMGLLRDDPAAFLRKIMPNLGRTAGEFSVVGKLRVRPINLYQWDGRGVDGVVAIGDAWSSSCPGAGTGTTKAINDALCLSKNHIPVWLEERGIHSTLFQPHRNMVL
ncbi:MAG: NAD(P)/FAD-dependent oxidoreductase, partial [Pseudomonadota bacterium]